MSIHSRLCDDIAAWRRSTEFYQREADERSRAGDEQAAEIYRQGIVSIAGWIERLSNKRMEIERIVNAPGR